MKRLHSYLAGTPATEQKSEVIALLAELDTLEKAHPLVANALIAELKQQRSQLKLIASENYSSLAVQLAMGNWLTDKYAEGVPGRRFYAGCEFVDQIEKEAQDEVKALFQCEYANVQPHSGADANLLAYWAILIQRVQIPGIARLGKKTLEELTAEEYEALRQEMMNQTIMGMGLGSGGHLTHGYRHNFSAKMMRAVQYDVDPKTQMLDYDLLADQVKSVKPLVLMAGYSAYPRRLNFARLREIADSVGAVLLVDMAHFAGLVAGKVFTGEANPIPYADIVTSTTHKTLRGPRGGIILAKKEWGTVLDKGCPLTMGGPLPHVIAAKAIAFREANSEAFCRYAAAIVTNAKALADELEQQGLKVTTGGTENHLMVVDVRPLGLTGMQAEKALRQAGMTLNRNSIPFDPQGAWHTSGIRLGTPALTTLGMGVNEMKKIAQLIVTVLKAVNKEDGSLPVEMIEHSKSQVAALLSQFPLYPELRID